MKKLLLVWTACLSLLTAQAAGGGWLERLQQAVRALGPYEVAFELTASEEYAASGSYRVAGESYLMELPDMRVFCDGTVRYEVNDRNREVVVDAVNDQSNNLLDNPVRAFDLAGEQYAVELLAESAGSVTLRLTPRDAAALATVELTLDRATALPTAVTYGADGMQIAVKIKSFKKSSAAFPSFRRSDFPTYEWIDFR